MDQSTNQNNNQQPCFRKAIGNTTYVVRVHFSGTAKEKLEDRIKRLIGEEVREIAWRNRDNHIEQQRSRIPFILTEKVE